MKIFLLLSLMTILIPAADWQNKDLTGEKSLQTINIKKPQDLKEFFSYSAGKEPLVCAHRGGDREFFPENCIATFENTLSVVHAMIETDPRYTKDSVIVLFHDATLDRTTNGTGRVIDYSYEELKKLRLKDSDGNLTEYKIPTLDEALEWARSKTILVLDRKDVPIETRVKKIMEHKAEAYAIVIAYSIDEIKRCYRLNPDIMMEVMLADSNQVNAFKETGVPWENIVGFVSHNLVRDTRIFDLIHQKGVKCIVGSSRNHDLSFKNNEITEYELAEKYREMINNGADIIEADLAIEAGKAISGYKPTRKRQMEYLDRGLIAVRTSGDSVYLGWRMAGTEPEDIAFNIYRQSGETKAVKLNVTPIVESTNYVDATVNLLTDNTYFIKAVIKGKEQENSKGFTLRSNSPVQQYINIPLRTPAGYTPNDASAGDLDGDGEYELIVHQTGRSIDTPSTGISGIPVFQAYKMDGTFLWEISLGRNIREGAHYTQFMVYDLDGDGISEFACKTADGTIDGLGKVIGDSTRDWRNLDRNSGPYYGKVLDGPEFFTVFSGRTGEALATVDYIPNRYPLNGWNGVGGNAGGDSTGNRVDRMLACVAYLDGIHPSVIMCRGYYGRSVLAAWDWRDGKLTSRWVFDSQDGENPYSGQGNHNLSVTDVDGDGRDEIIYGAMVVDDDGKGLFSTGLRHGDAIHAGDLDPERPGIEVFGIHENETNRSGPGVAVFDAATGEILFEGAMNLDVGRGVAGDIYAENPGAEMWWSGSEGLYNMKGEKIGETPSSTNFLIWWDDDLTRELLDGNHIDKYKAGRIFTADGCISNNGSKSTPALSADLFGDWREEVVFRTTDNKNLRIYTTTIPTPHRIYTLMHDRQYRLAIATQNVAYNQPPNTSFFIGTGMGKIPKPKITLIRNN